jgi:hypothetical protein
MDKKQGSINLLTLALKFHSNLPMSMNNIKNLAIASARTPVQRGKGRKERKRGRGKGRQGTGTSSKIQFYDHSTAYCISDGK